MKTAASGHRHRGGRAERDRRRGALALARSPASCGCGRSKPSTPPGTPPRSPGRSPASPSRTTSTRGWWCRPTAGRGCRWRRRRLALDDAKYDPAAHDPYQTSVVLAAGSGGNEFGQREIQALWSKGPQRGQRLPVDRLVLRRQRRADLDPARHQGPGLGAGLRGRRRARQPGRGPPGHPARHARPCWPAAPRRRCRPTRWSARSRAAASTRSRDPREGYLPFDVDANGYVPGEGGAVLVVEDEQAARGARRAADLRRDRRATRPRTTRTTTRIRRPTAASSSARCAARSPTRRSARTGGRWSSPTGRACPPWTRWRPRRSARCSAIVHGAGDRAAGLRRPAVLRRRRAQRGDRAAGAARRRRSRGRQPHPAGALVRAGLRPRTRASWRPTWCWSTPAAQGGFNSCMVLKRYREGER